MNWQRLIDKGDLIDLVRELTRDWQLCRRRFERKVPQAQEFDLLLERKLGTSQEMKSRDPEQLRVLRELRDEIDADSERVYDAFVDHVWPDAIEWLAIRIQVGSSELEKAAFAGFDPSELDDSPAGAPTSRVRNEIRKLMRALAEIPVREWRDSHWCLELASKSDDGGALDATGCEVASAERPNADDHGVRSDGYVETPIDPDSYFPSTRILDEAAKSGLRLTPKQLNRILENFEANGIRWTRPLSKSGSPHPQRRSIHMVDWKHFEQQCSSEGTSKFIDDEADLPPITPEEVEAGKARERQRAAQ